MASLSPSGGRYFETTELVFRSEDITAVGFDGPPAWSWTLSPIGETPSSSVEGVNITITPSGMKLIATYFTEENLFPIQKIVYLDKDMTRHTVDEWFEIPGINGSPDIVELHENWKSWCDWSLSVTAVGTSDSLPATASGSYVIRVYANYNTSRDTLRDMLDERY